MRPADIEKLLGGYATGTLTPEEQAALFEAALTNQALFDALADEETLRELLADERARAELLDALQPPAPARPRGLLAWIYARPVPVALAASVAVAVLAIGVLRYRSPEEQKVAMVDKAPMDPSVLALEQLPPEVRPKEKAPPPPAKRRETLERDRPAAQAAMADRGPAQESGRERQQTEELREQPAAQLAGRRMAAEGVAGPPVAEVAKKSADEQPAEEPAPRKALAARLGNEARDVSLAPAPVGASRPAAPPPVTTARQARPAAPAAPSETAAQRPSAAAAPPSPGAAPPSPTLKWSLLHRDDGGVYTETSAREFRAGETLRLRVVAPRDGHIYLIEEQDQALQERNVRAGEAAEFSISGAAGVKRLRIVSSATPLVGLQYRPQAGFSVRVKSEAAPAPVEIELTFR